jgi:hypothetical protein
LDRFLLETTPRLWNSAHADDRTSASHIPLCGTDERLSGFGVPA